MRKRNLRAVDDFGENKKRIKATNQPSYEPPSAETMTKEELSAWRKNQRRLRNRQSAATSRQKQKDRIEELEAEVAALQKRLRAYERAPQKDPSDASSNSTPAPFNSSLPVPAPPSGISRNRSIPISPTNSPVFTYCSHDMLKTYRSAVPTMWLVST